MAAGTSEAAYQQVWGHALELAPETAERLNLATGDRVVLKRGNVTVEVPVLLTGGLAREVMSLTFGYGRSRAGAVGTGIGANAYRLLAADARSRLVNVSVKKTSRREEVLLAQHLITEPDVGAETFRKLFPIAAPDHLHQVAPPLELASLYPDRPRPLADHQWGMVIDTRCASAATPASSLARSRTIAGRRPRRDRARARHALAAHRRL